MHGLMTSSNTVIMRCLTVTKQLSTQEDLGNFQRTKFSMICLLETFREYIFEDGSLETKKVEV